MNDEMQVRTNTTWDLTQLPANKNVVGCQKVFTVKVHPDGSLERLKARLVAKVHTQMYGVDFDDTFSPIAEIPSIWVFISLIVHYGWTFHQLDVKNVLFHGDLAEEIYIEQPPEFVA